MWDYNLSDLRYDITRGSLVVKPVGAAASLLPTSTTPSCEEVEAGQPMTPSQSAPSKRRPADSPAKIGDSKRIRSSKRASVATSSQPEQTSSSSNAGLQQVKDNIFTPLLHRAVSGEKDKISIFT